MEPIKHKLYVCIHAKTKFISVEKIKKNQKKKKKERKNVISE